MTSVGCGVCQREFQSAENLAYHHRITHKSNLFESSVLRNYELLEVDGETPKAKCLMCKAVVLPRNLSEHLKRHFESFTCEECGKIFGAKKDLKSHKEQHLAVQVVCPECGLAFGSKVVYRSHKIRKHGNKTNLSAPIDPNLPCHLCGKIVKKSSLKSHFKRLHQIPSDPEVSSEVKLKTNVVIKRRQNQLSQKLKEEQSSSGHSPNGRKHRGAKVTLKTASVTLCTFDGSPEENGEQQQLGSSQSEDAEKESKQKCGGGNARRKSKSIPRKSVNTVGQLDSNRDCDSGEEGNLEEIDVSQYFSQPSSSHSSAPTALEVKEEIPRNVELHNLAPIRHPPITELINNDSQLTCLTRVSDYLTPLEGISYPMVDSYYPNFNEPLPENVWQDSDSNLDGSKNFPVWVGGQHGSIGAALTQAIGIIDDNYDAVLPL